MAKVIIGSAIAALILLGVFIKELGEYCEDICPDYHDSRSEE